ncbi:MAG: hypothetical protein PQJ59_16745 [Spirochaetales bacterium]|nr:hypothetical protein [Spirochaetales bacterium]
MKLDETFSIVETPHGVDLVRLVMGSDKEGNPKEKEERRHYGAVYQALQGYLNWKIETDMESTPFIASIQKVIDTINETEKMIKDNFCVYVKTARGKDNG